MDAAVEAFDAAVELFLWSVLMRRQDLSICLLGELQVSINICISVVMIAIQPHLMSDDRSLDQLRCCLSAASATLI